MNVYCLTAYASQCVLKCILKNTTRTVLYRTLISYKYISITGFYKLLCLSTRHLDLAKGEKWLHQKSHLTSCEFSECIVPLCSWSLKTSRSPIRFCRQDCDCFTDSRKTILLPFITS